MADWVKIGDLVSAFESIYSSQAFSVPFVSPAAVRVDSVSSLPAGVAISFSAGVLTIFGSPVLGSVGSWPLRINLADSGGFVVSTISSRLSVLPFSESSSHLVSDESLLASKFYYDLAGGPLQKESLNG